MVLLTLPNYMNALPELLFEIISFYLIYSSPICSQILNR